MPFSVEIQSAKCRYNGRTIWMAEDYAELGENDKRLAG